MGKEHKACRLPKDHFSYLNLPPIVGEEKKEGHRMKGERGGKTWKGERVERKGVAYSEQKREEDDRETPWRRRPSIWQRDL